MKKTVEKLCLLITPTGFRPDPSCSVVQKETKELWQRIVREPYKVLYECAFGPQPEWMEAAGAYLYSIADHYLKVLTDKPDLELLREAASVEPDEETIRRFQDTVPFIPGTEWITEDWIRHVYAMLNDVFQTEIRDYGDSVKMYLAEKSQRLRVPERIFFHLVENKKDESYPFAFLATYATRDEKGAIRHMPLQYALTEYRDNRDKLMDLLACLNRAAEASKMIEHFVESGEMFHPLRLKPSEAYELLKDALAIEEAGIIFRLPNWWKKHSSSVGMSVQMEKGSSMLGMQTILEMVPHLEVDGENLTEEEIRSLLDQTEGLAFLKGKWVEVDHERLRELLETMDRYRGDITLMDALRMDLQSAGSGQKNDKEPAITNGAWLNGVLSQLRSPSSPDSSSVPASFQASLRPYQLQGFAWLKNMEMMGFGCCLADDMGLGKTVQVLAYLESLRMAKPDAHVLLIVPASLIGNWTKEKERFAPEMSLRVLHGMTAKAMEDVQPEDLAFLNITTYGMAARVEKLTEFAWDCVIADEAQAIKNPSTKQTKQIKKLRTGMRIAMTGTPIENNLTNLWSLFDFLDQGFLGSSAEFSAFCKNLEERPEVYPKLRQMISPFMLRRLKTDKSIISDLPEKMEQVEYVDLTKKQTVLYRKYVEDFERAIREVEGKQRRGMVLASLTKLKQICNHPDQYLDQEAYDPKESGKFEILEEICETIYEKRERVLVFTQFREIIPFLDSFLQKVFHCKGRVLHGVTSVSERTRIVEEFQGEEYIPYLVLSVRAAGVGLNLTNASHVIHFDRWWNPAVENQATDRAFRIGQKNNVMVYKLVCRGTIEEKINELIESKKKLAENVVDTSKGETQLANMSNDELISFLRLDIRS